MQIRELGVRLSFVPEDRLGMGLVGSMDIVDNMMLRSYRKGGIRSLCSARTPQRSGAAHHQRAGGRHAGHANTPVRKLSGGNVQKVLVGREIAAAPTVLMAAYPGARAGYQLCPTRSIDLLSEQKEAGVAVIFVGEDLDVLHRAVRSASWSSAAAA